MKNRLTIALVEAQIKEQKDFIALCEKSTNPQTMECVTNARGRLEAYEAVLWAMRGSLSLIIVPTKGI